MERTAKSKTVFQWDTPDDFQITLKPASIVQRSVAFLLDVVILGIGFVLLALAGLKLNPSPDLTPWIVVFLILIHFVLWNFYWIWCEWKRNGQTLGKQALGIQVVHIGKGQLGLPAVITRSLLREVEFWMPLRVLISFTAGVSGGMFLWCFTLLIVPFLNKRRRRLGDYFAGTGVVQKPPTPSKPENLLQKSRADGSKNHFFTTEMLETYGTIQLYALQDVLQKTLFSDRNQRRKNQKLLRKIKDKIVDKIDYPRSVPDDETRNFLLDFYREMRMYLENQLASGKKKREELKKDLDNPKNKEIRNYIKQKYPELE